MGFSRQKYPVAAIDVFAEAHRLYHNIKKKHETEDLSTVSFPGANRNRSTAIYAELAVELISELEAFIHEDVTTLLLFDNPTSKSDGRRQISSSYKKHRQEKPTTFYRTIDFVQFYCTQTFRSSAYVVRVPNREADDLIKTFLDTKGAGCFNLAEDQKVLMIANDSDWYACLASGADIWWHTAATEEPYTELHFKNEYGFYPSMSRVALMKALMGDRADNIEPVLRKRDISHEELLHLIQKYGENTGDAESLPARVSLDPFISERVRHLIADQRSQFLVNLQLTDGLPIQEARLLRHTFQCKDNGVLRRTLDKVLRSVIHPTEVRKPFRFGGVSANV